MDDTLCCSDNNQTIKSNYKVEISISKCILQRFVEITFSGIRRP